MNLLTSVAWGWVIRRAMEVGGWVGTLAAFYGALPDAQKQVINDAIGGNWQGITLGAIVPLAVGLWSYVWSFRTTVKPQVVTPDGKKVAIKTEAQASAVEHVAAAEKASRQPTLLERLFQRS